MQKPFSPNPRSESSLGTLESVPKKEEWAIINKYKALEFERMKHQEQMLDRQKKEQFRYLFHHLGMPWITRWTPAAMLSRRRGRRTECTTRGWQKLLNSRDRNSSSKSETGSWIVRTLMSKTWINLRTDRGWRMAIRVTTWRSELNQRKTTLKNLNFLGRKWWTHLISNCDRRVKSRNTTNCRIYS